MASWPDNNHVSQPNKKRVRSPGSAASSDWLLQKAGGAIERFLGINKKRTTPISNIIADSDSEDDGLADNQNVLHDISHDNGSPYLAGLESTPTTKPTTIVVPAATASKIQKGGSALQEQEYDSSSSISTSRKLNSSPLGLSATADTTPQQCNEAFLSASCKKDFQGINNDDLSSLDCDLYKASEEDDDLLDVEQYKKDTLDWSRILEKKREKEKRRQKKRKSRNKPSSPSSLSSLSTLASKRGSHVDALRTSRRDLQTPKARRTGSRWVSSLSPGRDMNDLDSESSASLKEPAAFDHTMDEFFNNDDPGNTERCAHVCKDGTECPYKVVKRGSLSVFCSGHDVLTAELLKRASKKGLVSLKSTADDDQSSVSSNDVSSDEAEDEVDLFSPDRPASFVRPYTHKEFVCMWKKVEGFLGETTDEIENRKQIRTANQSICREDTNGDSQCKAQYGRLLPRAMKRLIQEEKFLALGPDDVFLDIGHGIGNTCMHAAFTAGCEARGIEVVGNRNDVALSFRHHLLQQHEKDDKQRRIGKIVFRHGRLEDPHQREFLTNGVTKVFLNNFNGVFAERSVSHSCLWYLDDYCAALFALMKPGTILITTHPLNFGPDQGTANTLRTKYGLKKSSDASFYSFERLELGKACETVKWNQKSGNRNSIHVYKYTREQQEAGDRAVFMCTNRSCTFAMSGIALPATMENKEGRTVLNRCKCGIQAKSLRRSEGKRNYAI